MKQTTTIVNTTNHNCSYLITIEPGYVANGFATGGTLSTPNNAQGGITGVTTPGFLFIGNLGGNRFGPFGTTSWTLNVPAMSSVGFQIKGGSSTSAQAAFATPMTANLDMHIKITRI